MMGFRSRHTCERHNWVEGATDHWSAVLGRQAACAAKYLRAGGTQLAFLIFVSLLGALLLGAVGSMAEAAPAQ